VNLDQTLVLTGARSGLQDSAYHQVYQSLKDDILLTRGVLSMTASSDIMGHEILWSTSWWKLNGGDRQARNLFHLGVDDDFIKNYGLKMAAGRAFSKNLGNNQKKIILNETAVKIFGFASPKDAIGALLSGGQRGLDSMEVIGVAADYHYEGLQKTIQPLVLLPGRDRRQYYSIKMEGKDPASVLSLVKKRWESHFPGDPFQYFFLDEYFNRQYAENQRFGRVFLLFALLAIGIACFGLLGLSAYNVLQRTKEIGIRKVLGASVRSLVFKLSAEFLLLVGIAFVIAIPLAQLAMNDWLQGFAYRIRIGWWIYAVAGLSAMGIAMLTLSFQAIRAAFANPARSLRTE
jgi:putative ABC transport system permease protein